MTNRYYMLFYAVFMFFCPVTVIICCYFFIVQAVFKHEDEMRQQAKKMNVTSLRSGEQNQVSAEIRIAKIAIMNVTLWLFSWTPYMVFCVMGTWGDQSSITPLGSELQSLMAKTSCAYNPLIYCLSHPKFREVCTLIAHTFKAFSDLPSTNADSQTIAPLDVHCGGDQTEEDR
jgi:r-opsin